MPVALDQIPHIDVPGYDPSCLAAIDEMREQSWIARSDRGFELLTYEACDAAFHTPALLHGIQRLLPQMGLEQGDMVGTGRSLLMTEGEEHAALRRVVARWFTPRQVDQLRDRVRTLVESLVEPLTAAGGGDFMAEVARRLPGPVFCWMVGAPDVDGDRLYELSERLQAAFSGDPALADQVTVAGAEMATFVQELMDTKRVAPGDDLMTILLAAADDGTIEVADVFSLAFELLGASTDNTANSGGLALRLLGEHPGEWQRLVADPGLAPTAVEECARVDPRVPYVNQWAKGGARLLGLELPVDSDVWLALIGANHDPAVYPDPYRFDIGHVHARPQLNFGTGRHFCVGAALARMEMQVLLEVVASRWTAFDIVGDAEVRRDATGIVVTDLELAVTPA